MTATSATSSTPTPGPPELADSLLASLRRTVGVRPDAPALRVGTGADRTGKMRRQGVARRYADEIDALYAAKETSR